MPPLGSQYEQLTERYLDAGFLAIRPGVKTGMPIRIDNPLEVGADRLVNAVAAYERFGGACVVVDFGTGINFDAVSAEGEYLGGAIAPGLEISLTALVERAARIPRIELSEPRGRDRPLERGGDPVRRRLRLRRDDRRGRAADGGGARRGQPARDRRPRRPDRPLHGDDRRGRRDAYPDRTASHPCPQRLNDKPPLTDPFEIGGVRIANRVLLAPLAGIGNWFVRLQARRHGAGLAVSEMVSSFGLHHRNERTLRELMRIHPDEHPVSIQLFGHDPEAMRSGAAIAAETGADLIDINMGCPVRKVRKTGAGVELLTDPELALALVAAAREGSGLPVTVKLRSGLRAEDRSGFDLAVRLAEEGGAAAIAFHPRAATAGHKGEPDYALTRELAERLEVPVIVSGGLKSAEAARRAYRESGADAVMIARGSLGNPWVFEELTGRREGPPRREEIAAELLWTIDRAEEHLGSDRAARYLRKFYPWYVDSLGLDKETAQELQQSAGLDRARALVGAGASLRPIPASS